MLSDKQKQALSEIGDDTVCRITQRSRHFDAGCYLLKQNKPVSAHAVAALIKKGYLVQVDCPEKQRPPHSMYYRKKENQP